jgi:oligopeptide/dipeptide ABC transporter ATP-binding protein
VNAILEVSRLRVTYGSPSRRRSATVAVDDVSLTVSHRQTLGLIGESGSGKTTIGRAILGLVRPDSGQIHLGGTDVTNVPAQHRAGAVQVLQAVFQDPYSSLSPSRTIGQTLTEPLRRQRRLTKAEADRTVSELLERVGLPSDAAARYPYQFSGGQRQRIAIARALSISPKLIICDEPVSALDVSIQAHVLRLLTDLQSELGIAYLFIGHNLAVVRQVCENVAVLYKGQVLEEGPTSRLISEPLHPYTRALVAAAPVPDVDAQRARRAARAEAMRADAGAGGGSAAGCRYASRCPFAEAVCRQLRPALRKQAAASVACHMYDSASGHSRRYGIAAADDHRQN